MLISRERPPLTGAHSGQMAQARRALRAHCDKLASRARRAQAAMERLMECITKNHRDRQHPESVEDLRYYLKILDMDVRGARASPLAVPTLWRFLAAVGGACAAWHARLAATCI